MESEVIIKNIDQAYQQVIDILQQLDTEKRSLVARYIKELEEKKIIEIRNALQSLPTNNH